MFARCVLFLSLAMLPLVSGCGSEDETEAPNAAQAPDAEPPPPSPGFEEDDPTKYSATGGSGGGGGTDGSGGESGAAGAGVTLVNDDETIHGTPTVELVGNVVYALSPYTGLNIVDLSSDQPKPIGGYLIEAEPRSLHLRGNLVLAAYDYLGHWSSAGGTTSWSGSSAIVALDAKDPTHIVELARRSVPGNITDTYLTGDVLLVVSHKPDCCQGGATTVVTSFDASASGQVAQVSQITLASTIHPGTALAQGRLYVGVNGGANQSPAIQVIDVSDPTGKLFKGASVPVVGDVDNGSMLDEKDGVLRVASIQNSTSWPDVPKATVQTFQVVSSGQVVPLGSAIIETNAGVTLGAVRFDGDRVYIGLRGENRRHVFDLSLPALPKLLGVLDLPGWVYHFEPRGKRALALGFEQGQPGGGLFLALLDVTDATQAKLLDRANFADAWGQNPEDLSRVGKTLEIFDSLGTVIVTYHGQTKAYGSPAGCESWVGGSQIIDFTDDALKKQGSFASSEVVRRSFVLQNRIHAVSDASIETIDISSKAQPVGKGRLTRSSRVSKVAAAGARVARVAWKQNTRTTMLDVVPESSIELPMETGVELETALGSPAVSSCSTWGAGSIRVFDHDSMLYVLAGYDEHRLGVFETTSGVPVLAGQLTIPSKDSSAYATWSPLDFYYAPSIVSGGHSAVRSGTTLVVQQTANLGSYLAPKLESYVHVADLASPTKPKLTSLKLPAALGYTRLQVWGDEVLAGHWAPSPGAPGKVRFYLDRVDISAPASPKGLPELNVPGSLLAVSEQGTRLLTVRYQKVQELLTEGACRAKWGRLAELDWSASADPAKALCKGIRRVLNLVELGAFGPAILDTLELPSDGDVLRVETGADRVFLVITYPYHQPPEVELRTISGMASGKLASGAAALGPGALSSAANGLQLLATAERALVVNTNPARAFLVDAKNPTAPVASQIFSPEVEPYASVADGALIGGKLYLARGNYLPKVVQLDP